LRLGPDVHTLGSRRLRLARGQVAAWLRVRVRARARVRARVRVRVRVRVLEGKLLPGFSPATRMSVFPVTVLPTLVRVGVSVRVRGRVRISVFPVTVLPTLVRVGVRVRVRVRVKMSVFPVTALPTLAPAASALALASARGICSAPG
jgi:hypothetical protein